MGTTTTPVNAPASSTSGFAQGVLSGIKAPITNNNIANVQRWLGLEQGSSAANWAQNQNNPLGVTAPGKGVLHLASPSAGVTATVSTLLSGSYSSLVAALRNNAPPPLFAQALVSSPWQSGSPGGTTYSFKSASQIAKMSPFVVGPNPGVANPTGLFGQYLEKPTNWAAKNLPGAGLVYQATGGLSGAVDKVSSAASGVTSTASLIGKITNPSNLKNVGVFLAGMALTITGLIILFSSTKEGQRIAAEAPAAAAA